MREEKTGWCGTWAEAPDGTGALPGAAGREGIAECTGGWRPNWGPLPGAAAPVWEPTLPWLADVLPGAQVSPAAPDSRSRWDLPDRWNLPQAEAPIDPIVADWYAEEAPARGLRWPETQAEMEAFDPAGLAHNAIIGAPATRLLTGAPPAPRPLSSTALPEFDNDWVSVIPNPPRVPANANFTDSIFQMLRAISDENDTAGGWQTRAATDRELRQISADFATVIGAIDSLAGADGFIDLSSSAVSRAVLDAVLRLAGGHPDGAMSLLDAQNAVNRAQDEARHGPGWPYIDVATVLRLAVGRAAPNSAAYSALLAAGMFAALALPIFAKPLAAALVAASPQAAAKLKRLFGDAAVKAAQARANGHMRARLPGGEAQLRHIFANRVGHVVDTPANRQMLLNVANNVRNFMGINKDGNRVYTQILSNGSQVWVYVRDGIIQDAGANLAGAHWLWRQGIGLIRP